ncbi:MAG: hypothetical protein U9N02_07780 [Campylobacterota bacterium]|nr:hypothetical protein [Campylobacterota bacterium]
MQLKYVGPKPIISHKGIDFDKNKEDKFVYINIAVQLIKALDHDYFEDKAYTYNTDSAELNEEEIFHHLKRYCPDIESIMDKKNHDIEEETNEYLKRADANKVLNDENRQTLKSNIEIMHDYIVQRSINKSVYYASIEALANLVKEDHLDYIITPMYNKFAHVLHSVQGVLAKQKTPIDTDMEVYKEDGQLLVKLNVTSNLQ